MRVARVVVRLLLSPLEITVKVLKALCCLRRLVQSLWASVLLVNQGRGTQDLLEESEVVDSIFLPGRLRQALGRKREPARRKWFSFPASSLELKTFPGEGS